MSRELILIPKAQYEALLNTEGLKDIKSVKNINTSENATDEKNKENADKKDKIKQCDDIQMTETKHCEDNENTDNMYCRQNIKKTIKKRHQKQQNGAGKSYVKMSPKQFLNDKKLTLKNKWLSFPI